MPSTIKPDAQSPTTSAPTSRPIRFGLVSMAFGLALAVGCGEDGSTEDPVAEAPQPDMNPDPMPGMNPDPMPEPEPEPMPDMEPEVDPTLSMCGGFVPRGGAETPEACASCVDENCCDEAATCGEDPDCLALRQCFAACEFADTECNQACSGSVSQETLDVLNRPMITCRNTACGGECVPAVSLLCLGDPAPAPVATPGEVTLDVLFFDFQSGAVVSGAEVKFCVSDDDLCESPVSTQTTDDAGAVTAVLSIDADGFDGYMEITGGGVFPQRTHFRTPIVESGERGFSLLSELTFSGFAGLLQIEPDPERAYASVFMMDCAGLRASGVSFESSNADGQTRVGYLKGSLPDRNATETDGSGIGGIFNLPVGEATISGTHKSDVRLFEKDVFLRAGFLTSLSQNPNL